MRTLAILLAGACGTSTTTSPDATSTSGTLAFTGTTTDLAAVPVGAPVVTLGTSTATDLQRVGVVAAPVPFNQIDIPAHAANVQVVAGCALPQLDHVFAAYLHAHTLATDIVATLGSGAPLVD